MNADSIIKIIRSAIRPYITITGWSVGLGLMVWMAVRFAERDLALAIVGPIVGAIISTVNYWVGSRTAEKKNSGEGNG